MSLRARLLLAFAYVLVLVIVALEVPLALNLSKRGDSEIRSKAQGQAQLLAAGASGRLDDRAELNSMVETSARDLGGRVIVVNANGRLVADSAREGAGATTRAAPRWPARCEAAPLRASATATPSARTSCSPRSRSSAAAGPPAPCG